MSREVLSTRATRGAFLRGLRCALPSATPELHLTAAMAWLCRAQDACEGRGVSYGYDVRKGWLPAYPETTGYIISTLCDYAFRMAASHEVAAEYERRARGLANWLVQVQLDSGGIQGGTVARSPHATVFNTGQVLDGWSRVLRERDDPEIRGALVRAAAWMVSMQDEDGCWRRGLSPLTQQSPATYNVRSAAMLLRSGELLGEREWRTAAIRNGDWVLTQQHENGWFENNCLTDNTKPLTHTVGYTLEGLLDMAITLQAERYLAAVIRASDALVPAVQEKGFLSGRLDSSWRPAVSWSCLTGACQLSMVWFRLAGVTGDRRYSEAAGRVLDFVMATQHLEAVGLSDAAIVGAIKGSDPVWGRYEPFVYPNWATKFFADALIARIDDGKAAGGEGRVDTTKAGIETLRVGYFVENYATFVVNEIEELQRLGAVVTVFSAFRPQPMADPMKEAIRRRSLYFASYRKLAAANVRKACTMPMRYLAVGIKLLRERESLRLLLIGAYQAEIVDVQRLNHLHGTFGTRTTTLAYTVSQLSGVKYSFTTHAYDIFTQNPSLTWKTNAAAFMRTISDFNKRFIKESYPSVDIRLVRVLCLGVNTDALQPRGKEIRHQELRVLSVGDLIEKKGHTVLVQACERLMRRGVQFECFIVGDGPLRHRLELEISALEIGNHVHLMGALSHAAVLGELRQADIFVLPCLDRRSRGEHLDGIPVALMEAMAVGLPVVSSDLSGIPELIESGRTGLLVAPEDPDALADAVQRLADDPIVRHTLGAAARRTIVERFDLARNTCELARQMREVATQL